MADGLLLRDSYLERIFMRAIIYAAGISRRMSNLVPDGLKGLLRVGSKSLIEYQIGWLVDNKPKEIIIVIGLEHQRYIDELGHDFNGIPLKYVFNPDYKTKGNMLSLWHARDYCIDDIIFTTSDLLCDRRDIDHFMDSSDQNKILIDSDSRELFIDNDPVKVQIEDQRIVRIRKKINELDRIDGISIGIYQFSKKLITDLINTIENKIESGNDNLSLYYPIDDVLSLSDVNPVYTRTSKWLDIDTPEELLYAKKYIKKEIIKV